MFLYFIPGLVFFSSASLLRCILGWICFFRGIDFHSFLCFFLTIGVTFRYPCVNGLYPLELWTLVFSFTGSVYDSLLVVYSWGRGRS